MHGSKLYEDRETAIPGTPRRIAAALFPRAGLIWIRRDRGMESMHKETESICLLWHLRGELVMPENILKVKMLGGFSIYYGDKEIALDRNTTSKSMQLLQLILISMKAGGIAKTSLADALYGREEVENKNGSLNNTIFRLRKQLKTAGFPDSNYVVIKNGMCRWDESIPVEIDALRFEELIAQGKDKEETSEKMECFFEACKLYAGEFLPNMIGEDWVAVRNIRYQELYSSTLLVLLEWLNENERYEDVYRLSSTAADIYPFEDWALWQIDSLISMSRFREAMAVYEKVTKLFFDELGLPPSPELVSRSHIMADRISQSTGVIQDIKQRLREKEKTPGAYYCTYPSFVDIYHIISRMMERSGMSVYIMLCTMRRVREGYGDELKEQEDSFLLRKAIMMTLRRGDFYTKYNQQQYLVMLPGINQENCAKVSDRIDRAFSKLVRKGEYQVSYYIASVAEIDDITTDEPNQFQKGTGWN